MQLSTVTQGFYKISDFIPKMSLPSQTMVITAVTLYALASLPVVSAAANGGSGAYIACIQTCRAANPHSWITALVCPVICAPFLAL